MSGFVGDGAALVDAAGGERLEGDGLRAAVTRAQDRHAAWPQGCVVLILRPRFPEVVDHLALLEGGRPVLLLPAEVTSNGALRRVVERYRPAAVIGSDVGAAPSGMLGAPEVGLAAAAWVRRDPGAEVHPDLGLLLPTSGSTGDPKLVRISRASLLHNTGAIVEALGIQPHDVAATSLPLHYSFGMSVLNTHIYASATVVLTGHPTTTRPFWDAVDAHAVSSFAGVPQHFHALRRVRMDLASHPTLRDAVQAGGRLDPLVLADLDRDLRSRGGRVHVMYGQTEASPRMSVLPADELALRPGSVGPALRDGRFTIMLDDGTETAEPHREGVVVYRGPNVMLGYAETAEDLALGDVTGGVLRTGDRGHLDEEGRLFLSGRDSRIGKVFGKRVSLDDVEAVARGALEGRAECAATSVDDGVVVHVVLAGAGSNVDVARRALVSALAEAVGAHRSGFSVRVVDAIPRLPSGKTDYRRLAAGAE